MSPDRWRRLLKPAMRGDITLAQFEMRFMRVWRETRQRGERNPKAIEDLFHYVENYIPDRKQMRGSKDVDDQQLHAALRRADASLAPRGVLSFMRTWLSVLPIFVALAGTSLAQEASPPGAPPPPAAAPALPPNPIAVLEQCVRLRASQLEISKEAADLVAVAAIQKCSRELTAATPTGGVTRSLAEGRQQLKDAMREIAISEVVDIRTARYTPAPPPPPKAAEEVKPKPPVRRRTVRRTTAKPAVTAPKPAVAAPQP